MTIRFAILSAILAATVTGAFAQDPNAPLTTTDYRYVRKYSAGAMVGIFLPTLIPNNTLFLDTTTPLESDEFYTTNHSTRANFGGIFQVAFKNRWAINFQVNMRRPNFGVDTNRTIGADNPNIPGDQREFHRTEERTKAWFLDMPIVFRYYTVDHLDRGARFFFDFGGSVRHVMSIQTSTVNATRDTSVCCDTTPRVPQKSTVFGATAGIGFQLIDDFGIRSSPEIRYTRWFGQPFQTNYMSTRQNMFEILISFTF